MNYPKFTQDFHYMFVNNTLRVQSVLEALEGIPDTWCNSLTNSCYLWGISKYCWPINSMKYETHWWRPNSISPPFCILDCNNFLRMAGMYEERRDRQTISNRVRNFVRRENGAEVVGAFASVSCQPSLHRYKVLSLEIVWVFFLRLRSMRMGQMATSGR